MRCRFVVLLACAWLFAGPAAAHETKAAGPVQVNAGWSSEPPYAGIANAVEVTVTDSSGGPVTDAALTVVVSFGPPSSGPLTLGAAPGAPGKYQAALIPTRPGDYGFRVSGQAAGQQLDLSYSSADKKIDRVLTAGTAQFPSRDPSAAELATRTQRLSTRLDSANAAVARARLETKVVAVVAGAALLVALLSARRRRASA